ncbi:type IV toxin-antitoxin system AbiEi family antitoxin domain-containing protein [Nocardioides alkalitolerans]|uniref:type IV toxin-antitoxin system AbiEi family antitoxin domain-containing protein n=1 Tax=Nocardioides alkalitolerans TaxID=281714 RepID=UPI00040000FA|nr:type IV toxin-antitoxin system AbiEi family antitoxin domain-containing protein [Nocardioides alkalitolerans]
MNEPLPQLDSLIEKEGVFLRRDAVDRGYDDKVIARQLRSGAWIRVRHGAYTLPPIWDAADRRERHLLTARAVHRAAESDIAFSHTTSVLLHGGATWDLPLADVHVVRAGGRSGRATAGVRRHRAAVEEEGDLVVTDGLPHTSGARTVFEIISVVGAERALAVTNDLLHRKVVLMADIKEYEPRARHWPHTLGAEVVLRLADPRIETVGESRTLYLMFREGLPHPVPQFEVYDGAHLVGRVDFALPEHGVFIEFDGKAKYTTLRRAGESLDDVVLREKHRQELIANLTGWECIRITWAELSTPGVTAARIRAAIDRQRRRGRAAA